MYICHIFINTSILLILSVFCKLATMPNSGMLDHIRYKTPTFNTRGVGYDVSWLPSKPHTAMGYHTPRPSAKYSRHRSAIYTPTNPPPSARSFASPINTIHHSPGHGIISQMKNNDISPFFTLGKITCGYYYDRSTDHKKRFIGLPATDPVKWR